MKRMIGMMGVLAIAIIGCGGDSSTDSSSGTGRNAFGECPGDSAGSETCTGEDAYETCVIGKCDAQFKECLGDGYRSGNYGGVCSSEISCAMKCACGDTACEMKCYQSMSAACKTCSGKIDTCINGSGCPEPVCSSGTGGSGGTTGTGGTGGQNGGGSGGAHCPYTTQSFSCATACANLKQIAGKCKDDQSLPPSIRTTLVLASEGNGLKCKAACASDSPNFMNQWECFQGTPASADCTAIAGCTAGNCP